MSGAIDFYDVKVTKPNGIFIAMTLPWQRLNKDFAFGCILFLLFEIEKNDTLTKIEHNHLQKPSFLCFLEKKHQSYIGF